ncbi:hypothetical protein X943_003212 [Babesia divergens]|uniref:Uncharacterized protein n=1 Tax=Babesia divergens TaxID=32595 RepID=A0AAD9LFX8_BABDI|nr:hypothetical protein X943_003212 [Babesia divergens]
MAGQSVIPGTDKHEATENVLEGSFIALNIKAHSLFEWIGNILASVLIMKIPMGEPPLDKAGAILVSKPMVKILTGASRTINILSTPLAPSNSFALSGHIEEQEEKRREELRQTLLKGIGIFFTAGLAFMLCMLTVKIIICTNGPTRLKDTLTDILSFSEDSAEDGSEALAYHSYSSHNIFLAVSL